METPKQSQLAVRALLIPYAVAIAVTAAVFWVRQLLDPVLDGHYAITPFIFTVAFASWYGGWKPGLFVLVLSGLLPMCSYCKKVRNDRNYWQQVESYIAQHTGVSFSHGIGPQCWESTVRPQFQELGIELLARRS